MLGVAWLSWQTVEQISHGYTDISLFGVYFNKFEFVVFALSAALCFAGARHGSKWWYIPFYLFLVLSVARLVIPDLH
jgi:hypothetical protein